MVEKRMPMYGIIGIFRDFLAYYLTEYQYFSMRPSLFDKYYQIKLDIPCKFQLDISNNVDSMAKTTQNFTKLAVSLFALFAKSRDLTIITL